MAWNKVKFFWEHGLSGLVADDTAAGDYAAANLLQMREDTFWKGATSNQKSIIYDAGTGKLTNGDFEVGNTSGWGFNVDTGAGASATFAASGASPYEGSYKGLITITNGGPSINDVAVYQTGSSVKKGKKYVVLFASKATAARTIVLAAFDNISLANLGLNETVNLTTTNQEFAYSFIATADSSNVKFELRLGASNIDVEIDNCCYDEEKYYVADYFAVSGHNFGTINAELRLQSSNNNFSTAVGTFPTFTPQTDDTFVKEFTKQYARWWKFNMQSMTAVPQMAIGTWGPSTTIDFASASFDPEAQKIRANVNESQAGYLSGIHEHWRERNLQLRINNVPAFGTLHTDLKRWFDDHGMQLHFLGWETGEHSDEIWLVRNKDGVRNWPLKSGGLFRDIIINLTGRVE